MGCVRLEIRTVCVRLHLGRGGRLLADVDLAELLQEEEHGEVEVDVGLLEAPLAHVLNAVEQRQQLRRARARARQGKAAREARAV